MLTGHPLEDVEDIPRLALRLAQAADEEGLAPRAEGVSGAPSDLAVWRALHPGSAGDVFEAPGLHQIQREGELGPHRPHDEEAVIAGELMDLIASGHATPGVDAVATSERIVAKYRELWVELTGSETFDASERWKINSRVARLNELGFDIEELAIKTDASGTKVKIQPKVVDAGHHTRRLIRLTGLDVEENQARRLLNDLDQYRIEHPRPGADEEVLAHEWLSNAFEPVITSIPKDLSGRLEPAEIYHQVLEHRWYMSENQNRLVPLNEAVQSYIENVLVNRRDEESYLAPLTEAITLPNAVPSGTIVVAEDDDEVDWRDLV